MGRIKEITYTQLKQPKQFESITISATAVVNENENENAVIEELKRVVSQSLDKACQDYLDKINGKTSTPVMVTEHPIRTPDPIQPQKTIIQQNLENVASASGKTLVTPTKTEPLIEPNF